VSVRTGKPGYMIVLSLILISLIVAIVTTMANKSRIHIRYIKTMINREKAKMIAWSGVQVAKSQLANMGVVKDVKESSQDKNKNQKDKQKKQNGKKKKEKGGKRLEEAKQFITKLFPVINRWQTFKLNKKNDGITGELKICLGCEEGKIDINQFFDFVHKKFFGEGSKKNDYKKVMQQIFAQIKKVAGGEDVFSKFEKFLKDRQNKLYDPTELLKIKELERFKENVFYEPSGSVRSNTGKPKQTIYLSDIFTLWSFKKELNPWFLSHSLKVLLGLKVEVSGNVGLEEKTLQEKLKQFKLKLAWPDSWKNMLLPLYGKDFDHLPSEVSKVMSTKFEPKVFSVLSYGTVGDVTQKLFVIMERVALPKRKSSGSTSFEFRTKKFYWL